MHNSNSYPNKENTDMPKERIKNRDHMAQNSRENIKQNDTRIYLRMDNEDDRESQIDLINIVGHMKNKKKLYKYIFLVAICVGALVGFIITGVKCIGGHGSYARAVISFQYEGIESGTDPNGAAFDINKLKSPIVIEKALETLGDKKYDIEKIRQNIEIEGVIPQDAVERITVINKMAAEDVSNYEKILDVSYFPSQYIVYFHKDFGMSGAEAVQILDAVLESYRTYFLDTYANTEVLTVTGNLIDYKDYDYAEALDMLEAQMEIMQTYVSERREQAPEFRASGTGLSFGDIETALDTIYSIDIAKLNSYIESHTLTKDDQRQKEYYEYKIKKYNMDIAECQVQLSNVQSVIDKYQKDPVVIVSSQETTQQIEQTSEYYDQLLKQRLQLSEKIASLNTELNETYALLNAVNSKITRNMQDEFDYADEKMSSLASTISNWSELTEQTANEYYTTTLFSNAYKLCVPAQYKAAGGMVSVAKTIFMCVGVAIFITVVLWCADGLLCEIRHMRKIVNKNEK